MDKFQHYPDEIVTLGSQELTLSRAVRLVIALSPRPMFVSIYRESGRKPSVLTWAEIEWLATLPGYAIVSSPERDDTRQKSERRQ